MSKNFSDRWKKHLKPLENQFRIVRNNILESSDSDEETVSHPNWRGEFKIPSTPIPISPPSAAVNKPNHRSLQELINAMPPPALPPKHAYSPKILPTAPLLTTPTMPPPALPPKHAYSPKILPTAPLLTTPTMSPVEIKPLEPNLVLGGRPHSTTKIDVSPEVLPAKIIPTASVPATPIISPVEIKTLEPNLLLGGRLHSPIKIDVSPEVPAKIIPTASVLATPIPPQVEAEAQQIPTAELIKSELTSKLPDDYSKLTQAQKKAFDFNNQLREAAYECYLPKNQGFIIESIVKNLVSQKLINSIYEIVLQVCTTRNLPDDFMEIVGMHASTSGISHFTSTNDQHSDELNYAYKQKIDSNNSLTEEEYEDEGFDPKIGELKIQDSSPPPHHLSNWAGNFFSATKFAAENWRNPENSKMVAGTLSSKILSPKHTYLILQALKDAGAPEELYAQYESKDENLDNECSSEHKDLNAGSGNNNSLIPRTSDATNSNVTTMTKTITKIVTPKEKVFQSFFKAAEASHLPENHQILSNLLNHNSLLPQAEQLKIAKEIIYNNEKHAGAVPADLLTLASDVMLPAAFRLDRPFKSNTDPKEAIIKETDSSAAIKTNKDLTIIDTTLKTKLPPLTDIDFDKIITLLHDVHSQEDRLVIKKVISSHVISKEQVGLFNQEFVTEFLKPHTTAQTEILLSIAADVVDTYKIAQLAGEELSDIG